MNRCALGTPVELLFSNVAGNLFWLPELRVPVVRWQSRVVPTATIAELMHHLHATLADHAGEAVLIDATQVSAAECVESLRRGLRTTAEWLPLGRIRYWATVLPPGGDRPLRPRLRLPIARHVGSRAFFAQTPAQAIKWLRGRAAGAPPAPTLTRRLFDAGLLEFVTATYVANTWWLRPLHCLFVRYTGAGALPDLEEFHLWLTAQARLRCAARMLSDTRDYTTISAVDFARTIRHLGRSVLGPGGVRTWVTVCEPGTPVGSPAFNLVRHVRTQDVILHCAATLEGGLTAMNLLTGTPGQWLQPFMPGQPDADALSARSLRPG